MTPVKKLTLRQFEAEFSHWRTSIAKRPAFTDTSDTARDRRIERARESRWEFARLYLDGFVRAPAAPFHDQWEQISREDDTVHVVEAFRGSGKSTYFGFIDLVYRIVFCEMNFGIFASINEDKSKRFTGRILREIMWNQKIAQDFGEFDLSDYAKGAKNWAVTSQDGDTIEILAVSIGQDPRGLVSGPHRPDVARLDDIQNRKRSTNPKLVEETVEWITSDLIPALATPFHCQISATRVNDRDVLHKLDERAAESKYIKMYRFPAVRNGKATWPKYWPMSRLNKRRSIMTSADYSQEYLLIPKSLENFLFSESWIRYYEPVELPERLDAIVTWVDPSAKQGSKNDFKAVITVGAVGGEFFVLGCWIRRASTAAMIEAMYEQYETWSPTRMFYEDNGGQAILDEVLTLRAKEYGYTLPVRPETNTLNKIARIEQTLSVRVEKGKVRFLRDDPMHKLLVDQLLQIPHPSANDDGPDALEGAVRKAAAMIRRGSGIPKSAIPRQANSLLRGYSS